MKNIESQQLAPQTGEVVLYNPDDTIRLEVRMNDETVWLTQSQIALLFGCSVDNVGLHLKNIFEEDELDQKSTTEIFSVVRSEGSRMVKRNILHYNLDAILSVGYRVSSRNATKFRQWANQVLKDYLLKGYSVNQRIERLEQRVTQTENKIDFFVRTALPPVEGIFFDGQIFDAYELACRLIKSAKRRIVLIDNYIDESTLLMLEKRNKNVTATIYTHSIGEQLQLDIDRHNAQYQPITVLRYKKSHDRFLILDDDVYHVGASLKDLGKQWFAIKRMNEITAGDILGKI
ncbi:MAG: virulence RhuM family protein [Bacteroidales bacterium]|nr:virulence RhuM family protein [Bacteroidales bacterium]